MNLFKVIYLIFLWETYVRSLTLHVWSGLTFCPSYFEGSLNVESASYDATQAVLIRFGFSTICSIYFGTKKSHDVRDESLGYFTHGFNNQMILFSAESYGNIDTKRGCGSLQKTIHANVSSRRRFKQRWRLKGGNTPFSRLIRI